MNTCSQLFYKQPRCNTSLQNKSCFIYLFACLFLVCHVKKKKMVNIGWQNTNKEKVLESRAKKTLCYNKKHKTKKIRFFCWYSQQFAGKIHGKIIQSNGKLIQTSVIPVDKTNLVDYQLIQPEQSFYW